MIDPDRLARARRFLPQAVRPLVHNPMLRPHWIGDTDRFWFAEDAEGGPRYVIVDAATGARAGPYDQAGLLAALPEQQAAPALRPGEVVSPDGSMAAFRRGCDLWLRHLADDREARLTQDGAPHHAYGKSPDMNLTTVTLARRGIVLPAAVIWSPDSRRLLTSRLDETRLGDFPLVQHVPDDGSVRPVLHTMKFALSGDPEVPTETHVVIDVASGTLTVAPDAHVVHVMTAIERDEAWWSGDSATVYVIDRDRFWRSTRLLALDAATGAVRVVVEETAETFIDLNLSVSGLSNVRVLEDSGEVLWLSQRDGWAHLYLFDLATGALKHRVTQGEWVVRDIVRVDPAARRVYFLAAGVDRAMNPYDRVLCGAKLDGTGFAVLTPQPADHAVAIAQHRSPRDHIRPEFEIGRGMAPSCRYFVHTWSTVESLPVSELRRADGSLVAELGRAVLAPALAAGFRFPTRFEALADDGATELYGVVWRPTDFDPARKYPVIDWIYPGPQRGITPQVLLTDNMPELGRGMMPQAFAELGFIVVNLEGRGLPLRSKAMHDLSYRRLDDPGCLRDHMAVLRQLAGRHPEFDLSRVGIMGHSGGGYASVRAMLEYPDFFHVGVATSGNHDQMGYSFAWCEKYQGEFVRHADGGTSYSAAANPPLAHRLAGKLLLAYGDMDDNVHPALTIQLIDALIKADRDFDVLVLPGDDHTTVWSNPWFLRRAMAFLVEHLRA